MNISIHALREEGDEDALDFLFEVLGFLSTPSARRATCSVSGPAKQAKNFYPRPPRGGRPCTILIRDRAEWISIHALREEGDACVLASGGRCWRNFYPRPPRGGRPRALAACGLDRYFYPRPPRGGRPKQPMPTTPPGYFYPRPPRGGRPQRATRYRVASYFYPRPPRGGRRHSERHGTGLQAISIHALREEGDLPGINVGNITKTFLSTPSARRATAKTETKSLFSYKLYNILHEFRRALIYNGSKNYPNHAK